MVTVLARVVVVIGWVLHAHAVCLWMSLSIVIWRVKEFFITDELIILNRRGSVNSVISIVTHNHAIWCNEVLLFW